MKKKTIYVFLIICCLSLLSAARQIIYVPDNTCCNNRVNKNVIDATVKDHAPVETDLSFFNLFPFSI